MNCTKMKELASVMTPIFGVGISLECSLADRLSWRICVIGHLAYNILDAYMRHWSVKS